MSDSKDPAILRDLSRKLISASHILHYHNILDAYGHISARHPHDPNAFIMPRNMAPATISSLDDLVKYHVHDASPFDPSAPAGYVERYIHSEIFKRYPDVQSVIHSHAESVIPYCISKVQLKACYHMAGFLGTSTPTFEISDFYATGDTKDMLIRNIPLGEALAAHFTKTDNSSGGSEDNRDTALHSVVLMRGHGFTVAASGIEECVLRAIYTQKNAMIQTASMTLAASFHSSSSSKGSDIRYLDEEESTASTEMTKWSVMRPWNLWLREVEVSNLYVNHA